MPPKRVHVVYPGEKYGRLTVVSEIRTMISGGRPDGYVECLCDCGKIVKKMPKQLQSGHALSCGCLQKEKAALTCKSRKKHGESVSRSEEYRTWISMKERCYDHASPSYPIYGAVGITVCERWRKSYQNFLADMGRKPDSQYTIDRIRSERGYSPSNCKWSTKQEQAQNRSTTVWLTLGIRKLPITEWAKILGVHKSTISLRIKAGWSVEDTLTITDGRKQRRRQHSVG